VDFILKKITRKNKKRGKGGRRKRVKEENRVKGQKWLGIVEY